MKYIYSVISALSLICILLITYSCKTDSQEVYHFTKSYIDAEGNPDVFSLIEDLKEAGCYSSNQYMVGYSHNNYYTVKLSVKKELEIPKKFTDIIEKSKDPIQVAKAKDAIEKAKAIHEENKTKFNKAYHLLLYGFNQLKTKATDSLIYESSTDGCDTLNVAITFDETPSKFLLPGYEEGSMHSKLNNWTFLKNKSVIVIAEIGKDESTISFEYRTLLREEGDNIERAFCDPDTAAYDSVVMSSISSLPVRSVDVSYVFTPKINPENSDSIHCMFYFSDSKSPCVSVGKHYFIPMKVDDAKSLVEKIQKGLAEVTVAHKFVDIICMEQDPELRDAFGEPSFLFQVYASYAQGSPDNSLHKCLYISEGFFSKGNRRIPRINGNKYFLLGVINSDGVHILRLNTTYNFCLPLDWINIKSCVDYDNTYYDITK